MTTFTGTTAFSSANVYTTVADIKALLPDNSAAFGTSMDVLYGTLITQASRMIDAHLAREPGAFSVNAEVTRYFDGNGKLTLFIGELAAVPSAVKVAESGDVDGSGGTGGTYTTWAASDYFPEPYNALAQKRPIHWLTIDVQNGSKAIWYAFKKSVKITGYFGFATTANLPDEIVHATKIQVVRWWKRASQAYADAGANPMLGELAFVKKLDPEVEVILSARKFRWP